MQIILICFNTIINFKSIIWKKRFPINNTLQLSKFIATNYWWFSSFVNWYINIQGLFNAKVILVEELLWYALTDSWGDKWLHTFPKGISMKVNLIDRLDFDHAYHHVTIQQVCYYTTGTLLSA